MSECAELVLQRSCLKSGAAPVPEKIALDKARLVIGKGAPQIAVDVVLDGNNFISRRHAEVRLASDGSCIIHDLGSCNGLFVNDIRITAQKLEDGDVVQFGGSKNTPIGTRIEHCDACLKYTFCYRPGVSDANSKRRQRESSGSDCGSASSKRSKVVSPALKAPPASVAAGPVQSPRADITASDSAAPSVQHTTQRQQELEQQLVALSARLSQATKDLLTAKTQSDLQIEAINARNAAIASLNSQKSALEQNCGALSRVTEELRARLAEVLNEAHQLRTAAQQTDTELQRALAQLSAQAAAAKVVVPSTSSISSDTLLSSLQCPLCEQLLIDAVVLPCSHGFCRACVESRWAQGRQSSSNGVRGGSGGGGAAQKAACRCPRCDAVAATTSRGNAGENNSSSKGGRNTGRGSGGYGYGYVRSDHLDNLAWMVLETCAPAARKDHERREQHQRKVLQGLGIDPDMPLSSADEEVVTEEEGGAATATSAASTTGSSSSACDRTAADKNALAHSSRSRGAMVPVDMSSVNKREEKKAVEEMFCDYCGEDGHAEEHCPHRLHARPESGESTDCGETCDDEDDEEDM